MHRPLATSFALSIALAPFATCGRAPATGVTYDCADGRALTVAWADSSSAVVTLDGHTYRLTRPISVAGRWTSVDSTHVLVVTSDTASLARSGTVVRGGCVARNPELRRAGR